MNFIDQENNSNLEKLREQLNNLLLQRDVLEIEADALHSELTSPGLNGEPPIGINDSLIDAEGFPRGDIDIYNARNKRRRLSEINTDHKLLMKQIEKLMKDIFDLGGTSIPNNSNATNTIADNNNNEIKQTPHSHLHDPIAKLDEILLNSPAALAGIQEHDELLRFGHITSEDKQALQSIAKLVGESINQTIHILVRRSSPSHSHSSPSPSPSPSHVVELSLTPKAWGGRGLLGCHFTPWKKG